MGFKCLRHKGAFESESGLLHGFSTGVFEQNMRSNWLWAWLCMGNWR